MDEIINLNLDWRFHLGDEPGADYMGWDDAAWRAVTLPHDWLVEQPFDRRHASGTGYLPGGVAWYRRHLTLPDEVAGRRVRLTFGGAYRDAQVWFNSNYLGRRPYGYATFTYDVSAFARPGENVIAVRVAREEVADSRWFTGSGIYRDVALEVSAPTGFETDGVFVTARPEGEDAMLTICYETGGAASVSFALKGPDGLCADCRADGPSGSAQMLVRRPALWSPDSPALYTLICRACDEKGRGVDETCIPVGIRYFRFDADRGFFLNGENMKLKGVCVHHDAGALGAAVPKAVWARRLRAFKAMGCNAIRTAHNPPDPHLLELVRRAGLFGDGRGLRRVGGREEQVVAGAQRVPAQALRLRHGVSPVAPGRPGGHDPARPQPPQRDPVVDRQRDRLSQRPLCDAAV